MNVLFLLRITQTTSLFDEAFCSIKHKKGLKIGGSVVRSIPAIPFLLLLDNSEEEQNKNLPVELIIWAMGCR